MIVNNYCLAVIKNDLLLCFIDHYFYMDERVIMFNVQKFHEELLPSDKSCIKTDLAISTRISIKVKKNETPMAIGGN